MTREEYLSQDIVARLQDAIDLFEGETIRDPIVWAEGRECVTIKEVLTEAMTKIQDHQRVEANLAVACENLQKQLNRLQSD